MAPERDGSRPQLIAHLHTIALAAIAAAGAAFLWTMSSYHAANEGHVFEGDGIERIDRHEWFYTALIGEFILLLVAFIPLALLARIAYRACRYPT